MPERIRALGSALVVPTLAALIAWAGYLGLEREKNARAHAASLSDRQATKAAVQTDERRNAETHARAADRVSALDAEVKALKAEVARLKADGR